MSLLLKKVFSLAVPAMVATAAFLHAQAIGALVDATATPKSIEPFALARAAESPAAVASKSAAPILTHNVFDHLTPTLNAAPEALNNATFDDVDAAHAPRCDGVRTIVTVRDDNADKSFAALDVGGKRHLHRRGDSLENGLDVVFVGNDRVWLRRNGALCQSTLWDSAPAVKSGGPAPTQSALEQEIGTQIAKVGPTSYAIDRGAVSRIMEAQAELMKSPLIPEKEGGGVVGYRMTRVKPGSVLSMLGLEVNDRLDAFDGVSVSNMDGMMQVYARLSTGTLDRMTIQIMRNGKPMTLDYAVK